MEHVPLATTTDNPRPQAPANNCAPAGPHPDRLASPRVEVGASIYLGRLDDVSDVGGYMLNLLRERRFVDLRASGGCAHLHKDGVDVQYDPRTPYPYQVGCASGMTLAEAALGELRRFHRNFLDDLDELPAVSSPKQAAPVVTRHAARFAALMDVWEVCQ